ncbi:MAG: CRISPR-associated endonuclease Cas3'' [Promethearchaeota archaeon]
MERQHKLARSADEKRGVPSQLYKNHILAVVEIALFFAREMLRYQKKKPNVFEAIVHIASILHDLGKLDVLCQRILSGEASGRMLNHVDAGVASLLYLYQKTNNFAYLVAAILVHGHHIGFMNDHLRGSTGFTRASLLGDPNRLRDHSTMQKYLGSRSAQKNVRVDNYVNRHLEALLREHLDITGLSLKKLPSLKSVTALDIRLLSSCLVAADHADSSRHMGYPSITADSEIYLLRASERRKQLERKIRERFGKIGDHKDNPRQASRLRLFRAAKVGEIGAGFSAITGPVGSAKTTAFMEEALRCAEEKGSRRIFCLAPFNTIIDQTVQTYRDLLVLPDEYHPDRVVAAHHCNNDYGGQLTKAYNVSHMSPIVVTSGVQFFETLASNNPARIKKAHNIPGSIIICDEWHSLMPVALWGIASLWLRQLENDWGCTIIYSSGTPVNYWDMLPLQSDQVGNLPQIAPTRTISYPTAEKQLRAVEKKRIKYENMGVKTFQEMVEQVFDYPGPRLVVCNTVQNAALLAHYIAMKHGRGSVEHLSTALSPRDRAGYVDANGRRDPGIIDRIKERLDSGDPNWALVATSCVESGLDFSFRTGFVEERSVMAIIQVGGRVGRKLEYGCCVVYNFILNDPGLKTENPDFMVPSRILHAFFEEGITLSPDLCTLAQLRELEETFGRKTGYQRAVELVRAERTLSMKEVESLFRVIVTPTVPVLINSGIFQRFLEGEIEGSPWALQRDLQRESVQVYSSKLTKPEYPIVSLSDIVPHRLFETNRDWERFDPENIHIWAGGYDKSFLGYMNEVLFRLGVEGVERSAIPWDEELQQQYAK